MVTLNNTHTPLHPPQKPSRWLAAGLFPLATAGLLVTGWLIQLDCDPYAITDASSRFAGGIVSVTAFAILGSLIFLYRPENRIGWLTLGIAFALSTALWLDVYVMCGLAGIIAAPGKGMIAWLLYSYGMLAVIPMVVLLPMLFPTGHFSSPRWRWAMLSCLAGVLITGTLMGMGPTFRDATFYAFPMENPFAVAGLPAWWPPFFHDTRQAFFIALRLLAVVALVARFRRSVGDERQQIKWLAYFLAVTTGLAVLLFNIPTTFFGFDNLSSIWFSIIITIAFVGVPIVIGIAIFKYRLYDIDLIINRTLVYVGLTLLIVAVYTLVVGGLGLLFQSSGNLVISLIATALVAVLFQPARDWLQRTINRLMFGERDNPYAVLSTLGQQLQTTAVPSQTLSSLVQTLADTLKLPYTAIELVEEARRIPQAAIGQPLGDTVELSLRYQNETVGYLIVSPRSSGERFDKQERQLLESIAAQIGPVASATRLTTALQNARERLVLTREEERRRIRRDLHDGLGPTMASQTLRLEAVLELLLENPQGAFEQVEQLMGQTQQMVADIRRLVYELYPSALDELGLVAALRAHIGQMRGVNGRLPITIQAAQDPLPRLPAAIEVAAYRIALEAVTNTVRHAQASRCNVVVDAKDGNLHLTISDDGIGLPTTYQPGIGLASMQERSEELGGSCRIESQENGGTRVTAVLPYDRR